MLDGSSFNGSTTLNGTTVSQIGVANLANFTNGGTLVNSATLLWDGGSNTASGKVVVNSAATIQYFDSTGTITVNPGGLLTNKQTDLVLGGGSTTFIGSAAIPGGKIDLTGNSLQLRGGLLVNNGGNFSSGLGVRNGTTIVDYGGLAKGNGYYESIVTQNGGIYSPGNSPGLGQVGTFNMNGGGNYVFEINDATGIAGPTLPDTRGWDKTQVFTTLSFTATPANKFTIQLKSLLPPSGDVPGPMDHFAPNDSYSWMAFELMPGVHFLGTFDPNAINLMTSGIANTYNGTFSVTDINGNLFIQYTAVPEPSTWALIVLATLSGTTYLWYQLRTKQRLDNEFVEIER